MTSQEGNAESEASDSCGNSSGYKSSDSSQAGSDGNASDTVRQLSLFFVHGEVLLKTFF